MVEQPQKKGLQLGELRAITGSSSTDLRRRSGNNESRVEFSDGQPECTLSEEEPEPSEE